MLPGGSSELSDASSPPQGACTPYWHALQSILDPVPGVHAVPQSPLACQRWRGPSCSSLLHRLPPSLPSFQLNSRFSSLSPQCLYGCYVHSSIIPTFHRRCYWLLQVGGWDWILLASLAGAWEGSVEGAEVVWGSCA